jgi:hemerythrin superfamily protein
MVVSELQLHATLEEELLYPAAREALDDQALVDEARVEHDSMHSLIEQLQAMKPHDDLYAARFTVLCEYVAHHVKEEEGELFPELERVRLDWEGMAKKMKQRREALSAKPDFPAVDTELDAMPLLPASTKGSAQKTLAQPR